MPFLTFNRFDLYLELSLIIAMATVWIRHPRYSLLIVVTLITTFYLLFVPHHEELAFGIPDSSLASRVRRSHAIYDKFLVQRKGMIKKWGPEPKDISLYVVTRVFFRFSSL